LNLDQLACFQVLDYYFNLRPCTKVWLDVKMDQRDESAMERGVMECDAVVVGWSKLKPMLQTPAFGA
jgi:hypothetical protein